MRSMCRTSLAALILFAFAGCFPNPHTSKQAQGTGADSGEAPADGSPSDAGSSPADSVGGTDPATGSFEGRFSGDGLTLDLVRSGERFGGTVAFRGQVYPARLSRDGDGLKGSFTSKGKDYPITARVEGEGLVVTSSNKTYDLSRESAGDPIAEWLGNGESAELPTFGGDYLGTLGDRPASLKLMEAGSDLAGDLSCGGHRYALHGTQGLRSSTGFAQAAEGKGARLSFELTFADEDGVVILSLTGAGSDGASKHLVARFRRLD